MYLLKLVAFSTHLGYNSLLSHMGGGGGGGGGVCSALPYFLSKYFMNALLVISTF